jgi:hypothetical protein
MFGSGVLDTVIGVVFVFLLVSLLVTIVNEMISAALLSRAKWLEYGIKRLLGTEWATRFYDHPLIEGSSAAPVSRAAASARLRGNGPSYISSRAFANVVMDLVREGDTVLKDVQLKLQAVLDTASATNASVDAVRSGIADIAGKLASTHPVSSALAADLTRLLSAFPRTDADFIAKWLLQMDARVAALNDPGQAYLRQMLTDIVAAARQGQLGVTEIRSHVRTAIDAVPADASGNATRSELNMSLYRLDAGYTVRDAAADLQNFAQLLSARYVRQMIAGLPDARMSKTLLTLFDDAQSDVEKFKQNIEVWFNNAMDRVGGWYKRRSQLVIFAVSLGTAVTMNVDAMLVAKYLNANAGVREALVAQAKAFNEADNPAAGGKATAATPADITAGNTFSGTLRFDAPAAEAGTVTLASSDANITLESASFAVDKAATSVNYKVDTALATEPTTATIAATGAATGAQTLTISPSLPAQFRSVQAQLMQLSLPIGWVDKENASKQDAKMRLVNPFQGNFWSTVGFHLFGWLLTALAASLGAPFWFDTLNRLMSIRSAGKAPEEMPKAPEVVQAPMGPGESPGQANALAAIRRS